MSGQAGICYFDGRSVSQVFLTRLAESIAQVGPDGCGQYISHSAAMVHSAFHTTQESRVESQPLRSSRGFVMTLDGRLDNRDELIEELGDPLKPDSTDLNIVAAAFDRWESGVLAKLIGDWALSVWDPRAKELLLARDYVGVRHLYYYATPQSVLWCTLLASLLAIAERQFTLNDEYIAGYLALWPEAHLTPYREIHSVPPGGFVRILQGKTTIHSYWAFRPKSSIRYKTDAEYEGHFRHLFRQAVRRRLRSDKPILAELSGGLDSSSIVCMADDIFAKENIQTPRIDTISYYDPGEPSADDFYYLSKVEEKRGTVGYHIDLGEYAPSFFPDSYSLANVPGTLRRVQELAIEQFKFMQRGGHRVVLSGIGGDEFLGGVPDPRPQLADSIVQLRFRELARQLVAWSMVKKSPWIRLLLESLGLLLPRRLRTLMESGVRPEKWIGPVFARQHNLAGRALGPQERFGFRLPSRQEYARTLVVMSWQLSYSQPPPGVCAEIRYPYLDQSLVEFIISIPANQLLRPGQRRSLMRRGLADLLPREVWARKTKATAARHQMIALQRCWEELEVVLDSSVCGRLGYLNQDCFKRTLASAKSGELPTNLTRLVKGLSLELWVRDLAARGVIAIPQISLPLRTDVVQMKA